MADTDKPQIDKFKEAARELECEPRRSRRAGFRAPRRARPADDAPGGARRICAARPQNDWRGLPPDEIEVLGWAIQQVGLDLQAICVRELELTNLKLVERNQTLSEILTSTALAKA